MANLAQARKRVRQAEKNRQHNQSQKSAMRTALKKTLALIEKGEKEAVALAFKSTVKIVDRLAGRNVIHPKKAAHIKSRLNKKVHALSAS